MTFFYLTNFSYVKTVLTIWSVSQFAIFKNMHVFADPITYGLTVVGVLVVVSMLVLFPCSCFSPQAPLLGQEPPRQRRAMLPMGGHH